MREARDGERVSGRRPNSMRDACMARACTPPTVRQLRFTHLKHTEEDAGARRRRETCCEQALGEQGWAKVGGGGVRAGERGEGGEGGQGGEDEV